MMGVKKRDRERESKERVKGVTGMASCSKNCVGGDGVLVTEVSLRTGNSESIYIYACCFQ